MLSRFWNKQSHEDQQVYLETSACKRNSFRLQHPENTWVKVSNQYLPVNDLSIDGVSFDHDELKPNEVIGITIRLNNDILIEVSGKILYMKDATCGCCFTEISYPDKEVLNIYILEEKEKIKKQ